MDGLFFLLKEKKQSNNFFRAFHYLENVKSELITTQKTVSTREKKINDQNHLLEKQSLQQDIKINHLNDQIFRKYYIFKKIIL